jgi:hypothetical protein
MANSFHDYGKITGTAQSPSGGGGSTGILDDFEDGDITEYSGDTGDFKADDFFSTPDGTFYGVCNGGSWHAISRTDKTLQQGNTYGFYSAQRSKGEGYLAYGVQSANGYSNITGYFAGVDHETSPNSIVIFRIDGDATNDELSRTSVSTDLSTSNDDWSWYELEWTGTGKQTLTVYDSKGALAINSTSATDTTYTSGGFGFVSRNGAHIDAIQSI